MSVSCIDNDSVGTGINQCLHALQCIGSYTYSGSYAQATLFVLASHRFIFSFSDIFISDKTYQLTFFVYYRKFLNLVLLKNLRCSLHICTRSGSYDIVFSHDFVNTLCHVSFKTQVTVCNDTDQIFLVVYYRNTTDFIFGHDIKSIFHSRTSLNSHRIVNHTVFGTLYNCYLTSLFFYRHVLMDYTDTAFACDSDSHLCLGNSVHSSSYKRNLQINVA